jgi:hypothetical protein
MNTVTQVWSHIQTGLFPFLEEHLDPLSERQKRLVAILELITVENFVPVRWWHQGRPPKDRVCLAKAFTAKMVYNIAHTAELIEYLGTCPNLRRICGWDRVSQIPSEATFSRSFAEFVDNGLPARAHEALITKHYRDRIVGHISRDATDIKGREKPVAKPKKVDVPKPKKRGRPKKGEKRAPPEPSRLEKQLTMPIKEALADLPKGCDRGTKKKDGKTYHWIGYKLHVDWADGEIPIACVLTSASLHDSQAAIPLATLSDQRSISLYDLMDAAYDAELIKNHSLSLGHIPIIDHNPRRGQKIEMDPAKKRRYDERSTAERGFSLLKECFGGHHIRVRGYAKVLAHLMFGILALTAERLINLVT